MPHTAVRLLVLFAATAVLAACGQEAKPVAAKTDGDQIAVREAVADFLVAFAVGDGEAACSLMTDEAIAGVVEDGVERSAEEAFEVCADVIDDLGEFLEPEEREQLENPEFTSVEVTGNSALVGVTYDDTQIELERTDEGWRLAEGIE